MKKIFIMLLIALSITSNVMTTVNSIDNKVDTNTYEHVSNVA